MERYGRSPATEGSQPDPVAEWSSPGGETGLEEPMWRMGLGGGGGGGGGGESYPERPHEADCIYYLRTGFCGFGSRCRFNHPRDRSSALGARRDGGGEYPERVGQTVCQYFMRTGMCKFGASCKYHHPRHGGGSVNQVALNISGYPLRPDEKECTYYVKTGHCKFGATCKYHHPQPAGIQVPPPAPGPLQAQGPMPMPGIYPALQPPSSQQYGFMPGNWSIARPMLPGSYLHGPYSPMLLPSGVLPVSGWNPYQAPISPVASPGTQTTAGGGTIYGITQLSPSAPAYTGTYVSIPSSAGPSSSGQKEHPFPERPGQPECQHYMKTGDCKYGSSCKFHHPREWSTPKMSFVLSSMGLPLRPGAPLCTHYAQSGACRFGPSCKFHHPMGTLSYSPSASSLADMPVAPSVGSSMGTLAPSSSSADLRPELASGSNKDSFPTRMSSSLSVSSGSISSMIPKSGPHPHSHAQQSSSSPSVGSSSSGHGGEVHTSN